MEVMNYIEQVFITLNLAKGLKKNRVVEVMAQGFTTTCMGSNQLGPISELNP